MPEKQYVWTKSNTPVQLITVNYSCSVNIFQLYKYSCKIIELLQEMLLTDFNQELLQYLRPY